MILVLASIVDEEARGFVRQFPGSQARLLTCKSVASSRTRLRFPFFDDSYITVDDTRIHVGDIRGVLNLLPAILPGELFFYPPEEREYQAAEMQAMLVFFLNALRCPVINRPAPQSFQGVQMNPLHWSHIAYEAGIPLSALCHDTRTHASVIPAVLENACREVVCLDGSILGPRVPETDAYTLTLAARSRVSFLKAVYHIRSDRWPEFVKASCIPDIRNPLIRNELIQYLISICELYDPSMGVTGR